jgi:hypothetical protein
MYINININFMHASVYTYAAKFLIINGVQQGAIISPILFCVRYEDRLPALCDEGVGCFAYADDVTLY